MKSQAWLRLGLISLWIPEKEQASSTSTGYATIGAALQTSLVLACSRPMADKKLRTGKFCGRMCGLRTPVMEMFWNPATRVPYRPDGAGAADRHGGKSAQYQHVGLPSEHFLWATAVAWV